MSGHMNTKVRLVRCPRCQLVLPELPGVPVYKCGGCNTVLQAKQRTPETKEAGIQSPRTDGNGRKETDDISCCNHLIKDAPVSREESSARPNSKSDDDSDCVYGKKPDDEDSFSKVSVSPQFNCENEASSLERIEHMEQLKDNCTSDQGIRERGNAYDSCDSEWPQGRRVSEEFPTSMELTCNEMEDLSLEVQPGMDIEKDGYDSDRFAEEIEIGRGEGKRRYYEGSNFSDISSIMVDSSPEIGPEIGKHEPRGESVHISQQYSAGTKLAFHQSETKPARAEALIEAEEELISLKAEDFLYTKESDSIDAPESPLDEKISVESVLFPDEHNLELPLKLLPRDLNNASSADSLTNPPEAKARSGLVTRHRDLSKSPTQSYYAGNASVSSNDEIKDQVPSRFSKPPRRKLKNPTSITSNGHPKQDELGLKHFLSMKSEMHYPGYSRSQLDDQMSNESEVKLLGRKLTFLEGNRNTMKHSQYDHGDFLESTSYGQLSGSRMIPPVKEYVPRFSRDFQAGQRNGAPPSYQQGHSSGFGSPDTQFHSGPDKLELLKLVNELKDELERTKISNIGSPSRFTGERKYTSTIYQQVAPAGEHYADFPHSRCPTQYSCMKVLPQALKMSKVGFSGEAADYRRRGNHSCMHYFPQDNHYSANLPLHTCDEGCCSAHGDHTFDKSSYSAFSSPHRHSRYQFLRDQETKYDDLRHRENEIRRRRLRERIASPKLHVRPAAGGIPILACHHCFELLHLPADFLLSGRRVHHLKCSACGKIMNISLQSGRHLVPCIADTIAPPPSMVDERSYSFDRRQCASPSHPKKYPDGEPVSCSDDYGLSYDRSYSMGGEGLVVMPSQTLKYPPPNKTSSAFDPIDHQKVNSSSRQPQLRHKNSVENVRLTGPSATKSKGKLKEHGLIPGSTLHRLMGYSSPSQVIRP